MELETKLLMTFSTTAGRKVSLFITDPREDINETEPSDDFGDFGNFEEESDDADIQLAKNTSKPKKHGEELLSPLGAKIVQTETTEYDLQVS